ncbi:MAG TPA: hypothetical protein VH041_10845 [Caldimonas sp.]|jgi:hypothetical protein|nr:hypothetical protein [Caldimonas sp.]HEX4234794.1 hypothetical protein [Caldimonas sp.]
MATDRHRTPARRRAAGVVAVVALASAGGAAFADDSDCAIATARLRAQTVPVCTPVTRLSTAEVLACDAYVQLKTLVDDCRRVAVREDRRWLERYPDEATHRKAEAIELDSVIVKLRNPNERLGELRRQRRTLNEKAEFYKGKPLPRDLQRDINANDASLNALRDVFRGIEGEIAGIVDKFSDEREHLRKLWAGAAPGSLGAFVPRSASPAPTGSQQATKS